MMIPRYGLDVFAFSRIHRNSVSEAAHFASAISISTRYQAVDSFWKPGMKMTAIKAGTMFHIRKMAKNNGVSIINIHYG